MPRRPRKPEPLNIGDRPAHIGDYIRWLRESRGLTRSELAALVFADKGTVEKWEFGSRLPSEDKIKNLVDALEVDWYSTELLIALSTPGFHATATSVTWGDDTADQQHYLANSRGPACIHDLPHYDMPAANAEWCRLFPTLAPARADAGRPLNLIERLLNDPDGDNHIRNRLERAHVLIFGLRFMRPLADPVRYKEIVEACSQAPEFDRLWCTDPPLEAVYSQELTVWDPQRGRWITYGTRQTKPHFPPGPFVVYTLYERSSESGLE